MPTDNAHLTSRRSRSPRAGAVAGIVFSLLMGTFYVLIRVSIPVDPADGTEWLEQHSQTGILALSLVPFAGIAFLWFIGVIRDRIGKSEDQFFSSVFFGSGLLYLAMVFASAAVGAAILATYEVQPEGMFENGLYTFGREVTNQVSSIYAVRMASVFMLSLGTIWVRTRTMPLWLTVLTYGIAAVLLLVPVYNLWVSVLFPCWVMLVSIYILISNFRAGGHELGPASDSAGA